MCGVVWNMQVSDAGHISGFYCRVQPDQFYREVGRGGWGGRITIHTIHQPAS